MVSDDNIRHYDVHNDDINDYFPDYTTSCVFYNVYTQNNEKVSYR